MPGASYRIIDEPKPSPLNRFAVNPVWIVLASFILQPYAWIWFLFNSFALGSPTRVKEVVWAAAGLGLIALLGRLPIWAFDQDMLTVWEIKRYAPYWVILRQLVVISISYRLFLYQIAPHQILSYQRNR
jgi:hypothetical protein